MSILSDAVESADTKMLTISIKDSLPLVEITKQINAICDQIEELEYSIVIMQLSAECEELGNWPGKTNIQEVNRWERAIRRLERLVAVSIVVALGRIHGPLLDILLVSDYRIAKSDVCVNMAINKHHVWPSMSLYRLVNQVAMGSSRQLLLGLRSLSAQKALDLGIFDEVTDSTEEALKLILSRIKKMSPKEVAIRRQLMLEVATTPYEEAVGNYLAACDRELRRLQNQVQETEQ